jgi:mono/diheme cytochrome c family protein
MRSLDLNWTPKRFEICEALLSIAKEVPEMSEVFVRILRTSLLAGCFTIIAVVGPSASFAADAYKGKDIAERWCAGCHVVEREQQSPATDQAPPFASIARKPEFGADKLAILLLEPHLNMPKLALSRTEVANLAEYILSLK